MIVAEEADVHHAVADRLLPEGVLGIILLARRNAEIVTETTIAIAVGIETVLAALILGKLPSLSGLLSKLVR